MNQKVKRIIIEGNEDLTADERDMLMLKGIEKNLETGPIIGEAREVILTLSRNIAVRDLMFEVMKIDVEKREEIFKFVCKQTDIRDKKILAKREKCKN